jgi:uncharacterized protein (TIGR03032 family)
MPATGAATPMPDEMPAVTPATTHPFPYVVTEGFVPLLTALRCTLAVTTYQAGKLVLFRADGGRMSALFRTFGAAMGFAVAPGAAADRLAIGTRNSIWTLRNEPRIGRQLEPAGKHDACFVPRASHVTGDVRIHEMAWCGGNDAPAPGAPERPELWFVNTRFSCLCTMHPDYSFVPRWMPPFVSQLVPEDRCHLNGLAVVDGRPRYVTVLGTRDLREGWRDAKAHGGVVIDVDSGEPVTTGMAMPHSPRRHDSRLYVLNSGLGALEAVDVRSGKREPVARLPGYTRGLAFAGDYAFVGMSKIREKREFGGLPIESLKELKCGVVAVHVPSGTAEHWIEFQAGCEEIFDVQILRGTTFPAVIGLGKDTLNGVFAIPPRRAFSAPGFGDVR